MKRLFPLFSALAAVPFVALLLVSLGYTLGEASLLAVMFLPGLFAFRHFLPQIRFAERRRGALQLFYLTGAVLTFEYVALMLTNFYLRYNASVWRYDITMPDLLQNPLFIWYMNPEYDKTAKWTLYDLQAVLQQSGWMVPAYTMPKNIDSLVVMRVVVRQGMSRDMADMLLSDIGNAVAGFEKLKYPTQSRLDYEAKVKQKGRVFTH